MSIIYSDLFSMPQRRFVSGAIAGSEKLSLGLNPLNLLVNTTVINPQIPVLSGNEIDLKFGDTADFACVEGEDIYDVQYVIGLRGWI